MVSITTTPLFSDNSTSQSDIEAICNQYYQNSTNFITKNYDGIPENLIINLTVWFVLLVIFTFIRYIGDYGRFGLVQNSEERSRNRRYSSNAFTRWTSKFFTQKTPSDGFVSLSDNEQQSVVSTDDSTASTSSSSNTNNSNEPDSSHAEAYKDIHIFSWLVHMCKLKDQHIKDKSGEDALYYLVYQRYLIVYSIIITVLSVSILLPLNIYSRPNTSNYGLFSMTTILNIKPGSSILWVHLFLSWMFLCFGFIFVRLFSKRMSYTEGDYVSRTVLITNYPTKHCQTDIVYNHFSEAYPDLSIIDIQFAYDVNKLSKLNSERCKMKIGRIASEKIFEQTNQRPLMHPFHFGSFFEIFCCCCHRCMKDNNKKVTDSIEYYTQNENALQLKMCDYKQVVLKNPLGVVFVTFETKSMAEKFLNDYKFGLFAAPLRNCLVDKNRCTQCYLCQNIAQKSSFSNDIRSDKWQVKYATSPENIKWENISKYGLNWWFRVVLINVVLFILMIFFTTPAILLDKLTDWASFINYKEIEQYLPPYLIEFLPSLMLRLFAALMPVLVALTALAELQWTRSAENRSMMTKTFLLLLFMVLILPTLGLTSINALVDWFKDKSNIKWQCVSDNGAFFIKYVTTCSLIGTALDILRIPDLFLYLVRMLWSRSSAERLFVRMKVAFEFDYGVQYAWMICVFTITLCYSVVCPLITVFGLLYLIMKHLVDRYNLYFAYLPTKVDKRIHKTAITFTIASLIMLQFSIFFFIAVKNQKSVNTNAMFSVQIAIISLACILFFGRIFFGFFKRFSPFDNAPPVIVESQTNLDNDNANYLPDDIQDDIKIESTQQNNTVINTNQPANIKKTQIKKMKTKFFPSTKRKGAVPSASDLQSPFIPSILRSPSIENLQQKLEYLKKQKEDNQQQQLQIQNLDEPGLRSDSNLCLNDINIDLNIQDEEIRPAQFGSSYGALDTNVNMTTSTGNENPAFNHIN